MSDDEISDFNERVGKAMGQSIHNQMVNAARNVPPPPPAPFNRNPRPITSTAFPPVPPLPAPGSPVPIPTTPPVAVDAQMREAIAEDDGLSIIAEIAKYRLEKEAQSFTHSRPSFIYLSALEAEVLFEELIEKNKMYLILNSPMPYQLTTWEHLDGYLIFEMIIKIKEDQ